MQDLDIGFETLPHWLSEADKNYLAHTEGGYSIRELARLRGQHPSTICRQLPKIECKRDDPIVDHAFRQLGQVFLCAQRKSKGLRTMKNTMPKEVNVEKFEQDTLQALRSLGQKGAILAFAEDMDQPIIYVAASEDRPTATYAVARDIVDRLIISEWAVCAKKGRVIQYRLSLQGRAELDKRLRQSRDDETKETLSRRPKSRHAPHPSPIEALARRRDAEGQIFLGEALVKAAQRMREDYTIAHESFGSVQDWTGFKTMVAQSNRTEAADELHTSRARVIAALRDLGPGLGDVVLRCCCLAEGLEETEKAMGWSARSGKIVLRIALQRLALHYEKVARAGGDYIG